MRSEGKVWAIPLHKTYATNWITMLEGLFLAVAGAVFSYVIEKLEPANLIKKWLNREPSSLAFQKALSRAYTAFARQYPEYVASFFDKSFLTGKGAPELAKLLTRHLHPDPALFAQAWGTSIGFAINSQFCKDATKPTADFLKWLEAELKSEAVFQPIFDSRALESLPNLESQIEKLTAELRRGFDAALKNAKTYEKIALEIGGDVDGNIVIGDNNQVSVSNVYNHYHSGAFVTLNDYYIAPDAVFQRVRVNEFIGRDWLTAKVDAFLNDPNRKSGAVLLIGEAGVGKTSFMAHLVKERRYLHLFAEQVPGDANLQRALQSLGSQLVTRYQIDPYKDRDTLTQLAAFPDFLDKLLRLAVNTLTQDEKIVIVCDALDEAGTFPDGYAFGLPNVLPDNVYFILSQRPINTKLPNITPHIEKLDAQSDENLQDMEDYLKATAKRPEIQGQLRSKGYSDEFFIRMLKEKSLGVWMYLHYIIKEIESGSRAPLDLESLPIGLIGYYADYWDNWRHGRKGLGEGAKKWSDLYAPLLATLAAMQEPVTIEQIIQWGEINADASEASRLFQEDWRAFISERDNNYESLYTPYHASFRDFLTGKVELTKLLPTHSNFVRDIAQQTKEAHKRIVKLFRKDCSQNWGQLVEQDYPRLHLTRHLIEAGEYETLVNILTEGKENIAWAEARYKKEETYAGFLNDLEHVWHYAQENDYIILQIRCMLIENSIHSLAGNIQPVLLANLGKTGLWSYARCLTMIKQIPNFHQQADAIIQLAPNIPKSLLSEALSTTYEIKNESDRARVLVALAPHLNNELKAQLLAAAGQLKDEEERTRTISEITPFLDDELKAQVLFIVREIENESDRARVLTALAPHLNNELKAQLLAAVGEINVEFVRAHILSEITPYLNNELKEHVLLVAREIQDEYDRANTLSKISPYFNNELKVLCLEEALSSAREIQDEYLRALTLSEIVPHLNDELKTKTLEEALSTAREIEDLDDRTRLLSALTPILSDELGAKSFSPEHEIKDESVSAHKLSAIVPHINKEFKLQDLEKVLSKVREIQDESERAHTFSALAPHLNDELKAHLFSISRDIRDESARASFFSALAPYLNNELKEQVLLATREIQDESDRSRTLSEIVPYLNDELKGKLLSIAREIQGESARGNVLSTLASHLNGELKAQVLSEIPQKSADIFSDTFSKFFSELAPLFNNELNAQDEEKVIFPARAIQNEFDSTSLFSTLTPHLNDELKAQLLSIARKIKDESSENYTFSEIAHHLNDELKAQLLGAARGIQNESDRSRALSEIAPYLNNELKTQLLSIAIEMKNQYARASLFPALAPHLNDELQAQLLSATQEIQDIYWRAETFSKIAQHLNDNLKVRCLEAALSSARAIQDDDDRATVFSALAPHLNHELQTQLLSAASEIQNEYDRATVFSALAPHLNVELQAQLLSDMQRIVNEFDRARTLSALAPHLNDELQPQLLSIAQEIDYESARASLLSALAPHLNDELKAQLISIARDVKDEFDRARIFPALAPHLNDELQAQLLSATQEIQDIYWRARALSDIAPHLNDYLKVRCLETALSSARAIQDESNRTRTLSEIAVAFVGETKKSLLQELLLTDLSEDSLARTLDEWEKMHFSSLRNPLVQFLRTTSYKDRKKGLSRLAILIPAIVHFEGKGISNEILRAIMDTTRWWP